jgi:hypothetical protein
LKPSAFERTQAYLYGEAPWVRDGQESLGTAFRLRVEGPVYLWKNRGSMNRDELIADLNLLGQRGLRGRWQKLLRQAR